jgi:hypothetical protein
MLPAALNIEIAGFRAAYIREQLDKRLGRMVPEEEVADAVKPDDMYAIPAALRVGPIHTVR